MSKQRKTRTKTTLLNSFCIAISLYYAITPTAAMSDMCQ